MSDIFVYDPPRTTVNADTSSPPKKSPEVVFRHIYASFVDDMMFTGLSIIIEYCSPRNCPWKSKVSPEDTLSFKYLFVKYVLNV